MKKIETILPFFTGFYESIWLYSDTEYHEADNISDELESNYSLYDIAEAIAEIADYKGYMNDVSEQVTEAYESRLTSSGYVESINYQGIYSPKYYNFSTDKINVELVMSDENIAKLKKDFEDNKGNELLIKSIKDSFTSYDGFMSFHSNDIDSEEWSNFMDDEYKVIWLACNLSEILDGESFADNDIYYDVDDCHFCLYYSVDAVQKYLD